MRVTYYNTEGEEIVDGCKLFTNYVCSKDFVIDFISAIPWDRINLEEI